MTPIFGQAWLTARAITGGLFLVSFTLVFVGILMFGLRVFLHAPFGGRPGFYQCERLLIISGFLGVALGLAGLTGLLRQAGDPLLSEIGLTAYAVGVVLLAVVEVSWLTEARLPEQFIHTLLRLFVVASFVAQAVFGSALLATGLLPGWLGWTTIIWNLAWCAVMLRAGDPYYPFMHLQLPLLAGILLLASR